MNQAEVSTRRLVILGAGGHAKVLRALAFALGFDVIGVFAPDLVKTGQRLWLDVPVLGDDDTLAAGLDPSTVGVINGIGQRVGSSARQGVYRRFHDAGFIFPSLVHPSAWVAPTVLLGHGVQVMAGAVIQPDCRVDENTIVNTSASIDHDCAIGAHVHIAPGVTICGNVTIGESAFIGAGATLIQGIRIGESALVGAGETLVRNVEPHRVPVRFNPQSD